MKRFFTEILEQMRKMWQALETSQKITITLLVFAIIIGLFFIGLWGSKPDFETLFSNLDATDASEIVTKLDDAKIPYKLDAGGTTVLVPQKFVYEMRIQMASQGLPKGKGIGFEVFDTFKLGATDFTQKINYQRALQTELERTISQIAQIKQARVHIAMPDEQLFTDEKQYTTASVVLDIMGANGLSNKQVKGIVHLVASSIKGLSPDNLTIIDTNGTLLYSSDDTYGGGAGGFSSSHLEAQASFERSMERRIQSMLITVIGPNKSVVRVSAELDFDKEQVESEIYEPTEEPIQRSARMVEESYAAEGGTTTGVPGTATNIPGAAGGQAGSNSKYSRLEETQNFEVTKRIKHEVKAPGSVKKVSVAVILDRKVTDEQTRSLYQIVKAAVGIDENRGDSLVIENIAFDKSSMEQNLAEMEKAKQLEMILTIAKSVGTALFVLIFLVFLYKAIKKIPDSLSVGKKRDEALVEIESEAERKQRELDLEMEKLEALAMPTAESQKKIAMQKKIQVLIDKDKDNFVRILRSWLAED